MVLVDLLEIIRELTFRFSGNRTAIMKKILYRLRRRHKTIVQLC